ncbi:MAG TPA: hypothetical protein VF037_02930 [Gemmatimonadales bacterium]
MATRTGREREARAGRGSAGRKAAGAVRCRRKFLRFFPGGFRDETYLDWERDYKWAAHEQWRSVLDETELRRLLEAGRFEEVAQRAVRVESRTNLLFSFEKMALRDAVRTGDGAERFARGLHDFLHGDGETGERFDRWCAAIASLPRRQTRVLTWPLATVFGFIAQPARHFFLKPMVTRRAAEEYGVDFGYVSRPGAEAYERLLAFARLVKRDLADLKPRDMIDIQSFLWVQGSDEYEE